MLRQRFQREALELAEHVVVEHGRRFRSAGRGAAAGLMRTAQQGRVHVVGAARRGQNADGGGGRGERRCDVNAVESGAAAVAAMRTGFDGVGLESVCTEGQYQGSNYISVLHY